MAEDVLRQAAAWLDENLPVVMATIVRITGTSSQPLGARMIITTEERFVGAVSGGCVETDVYEAAQQVRRNGAPLVRHYTHVEEPLIEIGLNCDGAIDVLVERLDRDLLEQLTGTARGVNVTLCTPNQPTALDVHHTRVSSDGATPADLPESVIRDARAALHDGQPMTALYPDGRIALFEPVLPPPLLLIFGGNQIAVPLVRLARLMGFRTIVTDARPAYATREKHPDADAVLAAWPQDVIMQVGTDDQTYVVSLNHEPRFEDALFRALAGSPIRYLGAIGQRQRHAERLDRAHAEGFDMAQLPEIHTPVGLDLGGMTAEEIALSIMAEIIAVKNQRAGGMLCRA
jgi:xanthine dehydrogenase accessory factor